MKRPIVAAVATVGVLGAVAVAAPAAQASDTWLIANTSSVSWTVAQGLPDMVPPNSAATLSGDNVPACVVASIDCPSTIFPAGLGSGPVPASQGWITLGWSGPPDNGDNDNTWGTAWTSNDANNPGQLTLTVTDPFVDPSSSGCNVVTGNFTCTTYAPNGGVGVVIAGPPATASEAAVAVGGTVASVTPSGSALIPVAVASKGKSKVREHAVLTTADGTGVGEAKQVIHRGGTEFLEVKLDRALAAKINANKRITVYVSVRHADGTKGPQVKRHKVELRKLVPEPAWAGAFSRRTGGLL